MRQNDQLRALAERLTAEGRYTALWVSCEIAQAAGENASAAVTALVQSIHGRSSYLPEALRAPPPNEFEDLHELVRLELYLKAWTGLSPLPIVLFLDEIDSLYGASLISVLRQLRSGYADRPAGFPQSVALIGLRDVRDYRLEEGAASPGSAPRHRSTSRSSRSPCVISPPKKWPRFAGSTRERPVKSSSPKRWRASSS